MKNLKGMFQVVALPEDAADDAITFEQPLPDGGSSSKSNADLATWGQRLSNAASRLLMHWNSARIERAALAHALRWDGRSELARQVDIAFEYYAAWLEQITEIYRWHGENSHDDHERRAAQGFELLRAALAGQLEELRSRVQFLHARAADIRISGNLEVVADALLQLERDRLASALLKALEEQMAQPSRSAMDFAADLGRFEAAFPEVTRASEVELKNLGTLLAKRAGGRIGSVRQWFEQKGGPMLGMAATQIGFGVAGNVAHGWLLRVFG